jgi:DNA-binding response OmpR family regulator
MPNILLVHSDPNFVKDAASALQRAGHNVTTFYDSMEGLTALEATRFDILITRVRFPPGRPNGISLAHMARLRRPGIKVVFTLAPENAEYAAELGEYVVAPIDIAELVATVSN